MKTFGKWILIGIIGLSISTLTMTVKMGTDNAESETIGIQKKYGFPVAFKTTAPGLSWAQYDPIRFGLNSLIWMLFLAATASGLDRTKRNRRHSQNK
jgi:hypothetical protein